MAIRGHAHGLGNVFAEHVFVVDDFHAAAAENEARANHHRVATDLLDASEGFVDVRGHAAFRHRDAELVHHLAEQVAVFGDVDGVDARTENLDAFVGEGAGDVQRGLATELHDDASRLFLVVNLEHVFEAHRFEVELVGSVVVGRNGFRVAVHHDGFVAHLAESHGGVAAAVVEFDALADSVRATAENHDLLRVGGSSGFVLAVVGAVVVELVFDTAHRHCAPAFDNAEFGTLLANVLLADAEDLGNVLVAEAVLLGLDEIPFGRSPLAWVGLYFRGARRRFACHPPPKTKPRYAGLVPKGSLSLMRNRSQRMLILHRIFSLAAYVSVSPLALQERPYFHRSEEHSSL